MRIISVVLVALLLASAGASATSAKPAETHPGQRAFARELAKEAKRVRPDLDRAAIESVLGQAKFQQSIIDAMTRPAEKTKPWRDYRPIFMQPKRIDDGIAFARENAVLLEKVSKEFGVPSELIVAIIGVETNYGRITGKYRVLDALVTLAFYYPPRAPYFRGELKQLLLLPSDSLPYAIPQLTGSYAGAMGLGQFMPTSIAKWAKSYDADPRIDLWSSKPDIFASIANYFIAHGWEPGGPVVTAATPAAVRRNLQPANLEPVYSVGQLAEWGYAPKTKIDPDTLATLLRLDGDEGDEYWLIHRNFYVISRYNRSPLYSMAVYQLAQAIAAGSAPAAAR